MGNVKIFHTTELFRLLYSSKNIQTLFLSVPRRTEVSAKVPLLVSVTEEHGFTSILSSILKRGVIKRVFRQLKTHAYNI